jgi:hypothetical protein
MRHRTRDDFDGLHGFFTVVGQGVRRNDLPDEGSMRPLRQAMVIRSDEGRWRARLRAHPCVQPAGCGWQGVRDFVLQVEISHRKARRWRQAQGREVARTIGAMLERVSSGAERFAGVARFGLHPSGAFGGAHLDPGRTTGTAQGVRQRGCERHQQHRQDRDPGDKPMLGTKVAHGAIVFARFATPADGCPVRPGTGSRLCRAPCKCLAAGLGRPVSSRCDRVEPDAGRQSQARAPHRDVTRAAGTCRVTSTRRAARAGAS